MRKKWYLGFAILLLLIPYFYLLFDDIAWLLALVYFLIGVAVYDILQKHHSILRNFPILGHIRYILEFIRPEIRQYFFENDEDARPISREQRSMVYQRSKNENDTLPYGTLNEVYKPGYTWIAHSITPVHPNEVEDRILIGGKDCKQPYLASRLNISAMSFGALSPRAIEALNLGAKMGNFYHNTGEGGISSYHLQGGDLVFQVGTGYFGCRNSKGEFDPAEFQIEATRPEVKMIELKLSQGAKPGHGGILPAAKLTEEIAKVRKVPMGHDVLSPIAHSAFHTPIELLQFIQQMRDLSGGKPTGFKLCIGQRKQFLAICKAMLETSIYPDYIAIDGAEGGTGAAPREFSNYVGEPLESALLFVHNSLVGCNIRDKVHIVCSGKIISGFDMILHIALGADICNSARGMMISLGCVQARQCNLNTCPTGITTQSKRLQYGLVVDEKKIRVANFHKNTMHSFMEIVGAMGLHNPSEIKPYLLKRRISEIEIRPLNQVFNFIEQGSLLGNNLPEEFKEIWLRANSNEF